MTKKKSSKKAVKKTVKKVSPKKSTSKPSSMPVKEKQSSGQVKLWMNKFGYWIDLVRPALIALVVALAWLGQGQLWSRHLGTGMSLWLAAALVAVFAFFKNPEAPVATKPERQQKLIEALVLSLAIVLAFIIRVWRVTEIPHGYFFDEATNALIGLKMITDPGYLPIFGPPDAPAPTLYHYLNGLMQAIGGPEIIATKMVPVLLGTITIPMFYFLMRRVVSWPVALAGAFILAFMRWHINFSRINFIGIATPLFATAAAYFLLRGMETRNRWHMALSGLAVAAGLYTYYASNLIPFVLGPYMVLQLVWEKNFLKKQWLNLLVFLGVSFAIFAPLGHFALTNQHQFTARNGQVLIFNHVPPEQAMSAFWRNVRTTLLMFNFFGDTNPRHNIPEVPMLDFLSGILFGIGFIWSLVHIYRKQAFFMMWWLLIALVPGYLTIEAPQSYRCIGAIVPVAMMITMGLEQLWLAVNNLVEQINIKKWLWVGLALVLLIIGGRNTWDYFTRQSTDRACWSEFSAREYGMGKLIKTLGPDYHTYISASAFDFPTIRYLGYPHIDAEAFQMAGSIPSHYLGKKNLAYLLLPIHDGALELLRYYYPKGEEKVYMSPYEFSLFTAYLVKQDELEKTKGLLATYRDADGKEVTRVEGKEYVDINVSELGLKLPVKAKWEGIISVSAFGPYNFMLQGARQANISIDRHKLDGHAIKLAQGQHKIEIEAMLTQSNHPVQLLWQQGGSGESTVVPGRICVPRSDSHGLTGSYWRNADWKGQTNYQRVDPLMSFVGADFPMVAPFSAKWSGKIIIPETGNYQFGLLPNEQAWLTIDNDLIIENTQPDYYQEGEVFLKKGIHQIRIDYRKSFGAYPRLVFYWTPPGQAKSKVPFTALIPE